MHAAARCIDLAQSRRRWASIGTRAPPLSSRMSASSACYSSTPCPQPVALLQRATAEIEIAVVTVTVDAIVNTVTVKVVVVLEMMNEYVKLLFRLSLLMMLRFWEFQ